MTTTATKPDFERIDAVMAYIKEHPSEWDQRQWAGRGPSCGTAYCFAGTAVHLAGYDLEWEPSFVGNLGMSNIQEVADYTTDGEEIAWLAQSLLGLIEEEADELFDIFNDIDHLEHIIANLKEKYAGA